MFIKILFATTLLVTASAAFADEPGTCSGSTTPYDAYCDSFGETACRMNSNLCDWYPTVASTGSCEPTDGGNPAYASYCESFDESACEANMQLCYWIP
jgi:hypothetical protein